MMSGGYNKKADTLRVGFQGSRKDDQTFLAGAAPGLVAGLTVASGALVLGGLAAVAVGECAPAASIGLAGSGGT
jgi:hypothetical protein